LCSAEAPLPERLSALDATITLLSRDGGLDPDDPRSTEILHDQMSQIISLPGGAAALVARYSGDERAAVVRPLAFVLASAVNDRDGARALAETVLAMIGGLRTDDPWPRFNLCAAVQYLLIFGVVGSLDVTASSALSRLLQEGLAGIPPLRATAAAVVADLFYRQRTDAVPAADLATLRTMLLNLVDDTDELTRKEAQGLHEFLNKVSPSG
jgi:hypothetical protein